MPWSGKLSKGQVRNNYATFLVVKDNREVDFIKAPIKDGTANIDGFPRVATSDHVLTYKGKPFIIQSYWDMMPYSPTQAYEEADKNKTTMAGRRLVLSKLEKEQIQPTKSGGKMLGWIILIVAILGAAYYFLKGGKLF